MQDSLEIYCLIIHLTAHSVLLSLALPAAIPLLDPLRYRTTTWNNLPTSSYCNNTSFF